MSTTFVVNADDFGLTPEINQGILEAHTRGVVTSTSVMTNMPHFEAIRAAQRRSPELGVGLHLCLSEGTPVLPPGRVASLVDANEQFYDRKKLFARIRHGEIDWNEVTAEVRAQADRLQQLGIHTDHWNSHQYVHLHPKLLAAIMASLSARQFPCMRTHRRAYVAQGGWIRGVGLAAFYGRMPLRLIKDLYFEVQNHRLERDGFKLADGQLTRVPFRAAYGVLTENITAKAPAGVFEWICHPSTIRRPEDKEAMDRPGELALLTDPALKTALDRVGTRLANFGVLAERSSVVP